MLLFGWNTTKSHANNYIAKGRPTPLGTTPMSRNIFHMIGHSLAIFPQQHPSEPHTIQKSDLLKRTNPFSDQRSHTRIFDRFIRTSAFHTSCLHTLPQTLLPFQIKNPRSTLLAMQRSHRRKLRKFILCGVSTRLRVKILLCLIALGIAILFT